MQELTEVGKIYKVVHIYLHSNPLGGNNWATDYKNTDIFKNTSSGL